LWRSLGWPQKFTESLTLSKSANFANLRAIDFSNAQISSLSAADMLPFANLEFFRLFNNKLVSIEGNLFSENSQLRYIDFGANFLQNVGTNLLANLNLLFAAGFSRN
jgi:Leucine-rich repeat (LRR) protein